ncbi:MAG: TauD/TfdA family dioxygenase [Alphaproteobacteria bacterium]
MLSVKPLPGPFGAEIEGLDLRQPLDRDTIKELIDAFHTHKVIAVRGQRLEFEDFDRVTREFGDQKPHFLDHLRLRGHPAILMLSNMFEDGKPLGVFEGAAFWHTDVAYQDPPNSSTVVYSIKNPDRGCPTSFADCVAAYDALSETMKAFVDDKVVLHHYGNRADMDEDSPTSAERLTPAQKANVTNVYMPLVRRHHVTGTKALYGCAGSSFAIVGMPDDEAADLLDELAAHCVQDRFTTSYDYEVGDLAAWDTFQTLHMATLQKPATDDTDSRILWRVSVTGKPPVYRH